MTCTLSLIWDKTVVIQFVFNVESCISSECFSHLPAILTTCNLCWLMFIQSRSIWYIHWVSPGHSQGEWTQLSQVTAYGTKSGSSCSDVCNFFALGRSLPGYSEYEKVWSSKNNSQGNPEALMPKDYPKKIWMEPSASSVENSECPSMESFPLNTMDCSTLWHSLFK